MENKRKPTKISEKEKKRKKVGRRGERGLTVAGDGGVGGGREGPLGVIELRGREEGADGLVSGAGVAQAVEPENEATGGGGHGAVREQTSGSALDEGGEEGGGGEGDGDEGEGF